MERDKYTQLGRDWFPVFDDDSVFRELACRSLIDVVNQFSHRITMLFVEAAIRHLLPALSLFISHD
jgi:hypothetical protein